MGIADLLTIYLALAALMLSGYTLHRQSWWERRQRAAVSGRIVARLVRLGNALLEFARWLEDLEARKKTSTPFIVGIARRILAELEPLDGELRRLSDDAATADPGVMAYMDIALNGIADAKTYARSIVAEPSDHEAIPGYRANLHDRLMKSSGALISANALLLTTDPDLNQSQRDYHHLMKSATMHVLKEFPSSERVTPRDGT